MTARQLPDIAERLLLVFWVGSLWTIGYVVAPTLFAMLDDRALAGRIAGQMFHMESYISVVCGGLLLLLQGVSGSARHKAGPRMWLVIGIVALIAAGEWLIGPEVAETPRGSQAFAVWHGVAAALYLTASQCGLALVVVSRRVSPAA